jgi:predicted enzyme related to lactoylglutathione lyase
MIDVNDAPMPPIRLELVPVPVADVDRAKDFYLRAGFKLEMDVHPIETMRVVQFTPPESACSIVFGTGMEGISDMEPGSVKGLHLVVRDMAEARDALVGRGIEVGEVLDMQGVLYAQFIDPDGNLWLLQQFPADYAS